MKKLFIFVISLFVCVGVFQNRVMADDTSDWYDSMPTSVDPVNDDLLYENGKYPNPFVLNFDTDVFGKELPTNSMYADSTYKNVYIGQLETLTFGNAKTKPRSDFAISWAEAICEAAEVSYRQKGKGDSDLSEMYLAWNTYNNGGVSTTKTGKDIFDIGGNPVMATLALVNSTGFVKENKFPNTKKDSLTNEFVNQHTSNVNADYVVKNVSWYTLKTEKDILRAKEAITTTGPLAVPVYISDEWLRNKKPMGAYGNSILSKTDIFTTEQLVKDVLGANTKYEPNYVGLIVGWDDGVDGNSETKGDFNIDLINTFNASPYNLPNPNDVYKTWLDTHSKPIYWKTLEPCQPNNDGCWIIKLNLSGDEENYYYYSYEDALLSESVAVGLTIEEAPDEITTFQYDTNSGFNYYDTGKNEAVVYNVFKPQSKEQIDSVGLFTYQNNVTCDVFVYTSDKELTNETLNQVLTNDLFYCMSRKGLSYPTAGFHKVDFKGKPTDPSYYNSMNYAAYQNENVYVIVKYSTPAGTNVLLPVNGEAGTYGSVKLTATNANAISKIVVDGEHKDLVTLAKGAAKIKLNTHSVSNKINYHLPNGVSLPENAENFYIDGDINPNFVEPIKEGYEFLSWYNSETNLSDDNRVRIKPWVVKGDLDLYPAFKQRIVFDYGDEEGYEAENKNKKIIVNVDKYDANGNAQNFEVPTNTVKNGTKEFMGWGLTDKNGNVVTKNDEPVITIGLADWYYKFDNGKLNGADIVLKPVWKTITSTIDLPGQTKEDVQKIYDEMQYGQVQYISPAAGQVVSVVSDSLDGAVDAKEDKKVILWFKTEEIKKDTSENVDFEGLKEIFEKKTEITGTASGTMKTMVVSKMVDINLFAKEEDETEGTKVPELKKKIELEYDLSGDENKELREAAEKGKLCITQMHNGEVIQIEEEDISYDATTQKIKFKTSQFSIFAFGIAQSTPAPTPSGESEASGEDNTGSGSKNTDNKQSDTNTNTNSNTNTNTNSNTNQNTPDPNFKTPNTGIY